MFYLRKVLYCYVFIGFSGALAGSYEDFFKAIELDNPVAIQELLRRGFDPNTVNPAGQPGLIVAIRSEAKQVAAVLIDAPDTKVEVRTVQDESPLMFAALKGYLDLCKKLILRNADVNKVGWSPLHYAAANGHVAVIALLLENHAYPDAESPNGTTPLMMAAMYGSAASVEALVGGADPSLKNHLGMAALDFAARGARSDAQELIAAYLRASKPKGAW